MKRSTLLFAASFGAMYLLINFSCSKKDSDGGGGTPDTGKDSALINMGNNIIIPNYQLLVSTVSSLDSAISDFNQSPDATKLSGVQAIFKAAYIDFQAASEFGFGPDDQGKLTSLNLFPANAHMIDSNINANNTNIDALANKSARGFPALDYLLFGAGNASLLVQFTTDADAGSRKQYLAAVSTGIKTTASSILNAWLPSGGNYISTFISGSGTSIGSSLGQLINSVDKDYEILKNNRLGIPLGKQTLGALKPEEVEGYYSGISSSLALAQFKAVQSIYLCTGTHGNGKGLSSYLVAINAQYNGGSLDAAIKNQFTTALSKLQAIPDPLSSTVQTSTATVDAAYTEVQKLLVLLKTDMPSALGVLITYADTDGD